MESLPRLDNTRQICRSVVDGCGTFDYHFS